MFSCHYYSIRLDERGIHIKTKDLQNTLKHASKDSLKDIVKSIDAIDFVSYLEDLFTEKNMSKSEVISKTNLSRTYAYQIFSKERNGGRSKIIQIGVALGCNLDEINRLLTLSDHASLYAKIEADALIIYAIENGYDVLELNELLNDHNLEEL